MDQIHINLIAREDRNGRKYYIANPSLDIEINLDKMVFFVFVSEDGEESIVIRKRQPKEDRNSRYSDHDSPEDGNGSDPKTR